MMKITEAGSLDECVDISTGLGEARQALIPRFEHLRSKWVIPALV